MMKLNNWTLFEKIWLVVATAAIVFVSIAGKADWISFISSVSGIICVILAAKGKIATFYFGIVQAATYAWVSYGYGLYGEAMLNAFFFLPFQFIGWYVWHKNRKNNTQANRGEDVFAKRLTKKQWMVIVPVLAVAIVAYSFILSALNAQQVRIDSAAVVLSVFAQILMSLRYAEQWVMWIIINLLTISLWVLTLVQSGGNDWVVLVMWIAFLANSIYGWWNWRKLAEADKISGVSEVTAHA